MLQDSVFAVSTYEACIGELGSHFHFFGGKAVGEGLWAKLNAAEFPVQPQCEYCITAFMKDTLYGIFPPSNQTDIRMRQSLYIQLLTLTRLC